MRFFFFWRGGDWRSLSQGREEEVEGGVKGPKKKQSLKLTEETSAHSPVGLGPLERGYQNPARRMISDSLLYLLRYALM